MSEIMTYKKGEALQLNDLADLPPGSWYIKETEQFIRSRPGHSITSVTQGKTEDTRFTAIFCGDVNLEKDIAVQYALNSL